MNIKFLGPWVSPTGPMDILNILGYGHLLYMVLRFMVRGMK